MLFALDEEDIFKRKTWADHVEEDEKGEQFVVDDLQDTHYTWSSRQQSSQSKEGAVAVYTKDEQISNLSTSVQSKTKLSQNAAVYVPSGQQ